MSNAAIPGNPKNPDVDGGMGGRPPGIMYSMGGSHSHVRKSMRNKNRGNGTVHSVSFVFFMQTPASHYNINN